MFVLNNNEYEQTREYLERYCTILNNNVMNSIVNDIDFVKEYLRINETEFSNLLNIPRSSLNNWRNNKTAISNNQYEKVYSFIYDQGIKINNLKSQLYKDSENRNRIILFHGAKKATEGNIDLKHSKDGNDFGKGFYLGQDLYQAASFVSNNMNSSVYICEYAKNKDLKIKEFDVNEERMLAVAYYRGKLENYSLSKKVKNIINKIEKSDIVIAPITDNNMYQIIDSFVNGEITILQCVNSLSASDLGKQYVFLTNKALKSLKIKERCYLCNDERKYYENIKNENNTNGRQKVNGGGNLSVHFFDTPEEVRFIFWVNDIVYVKENIFCKTVRCVVTGRDTFDDPQYHCFTDIYRVKTLDYKQGDSNYMHCWVSRDDIVNQGD